MHIALKERFVSSWETEQFLGNNETAIIGVSGGPDSVTLLHLILQTKKRLGANWNLHIAHLNHLLRGADSDADAEFVKKLAKKFELLATIESEDINKKAEDERRSIEDAARTARRELFTRVASEIGAHKLFLAHNADDQAETILMRILRGTGLKGLSAMSVRTPFNDKYEIIRPLLTISRKEILEYLKIENIACRIDASNMDTRFTRNKVRHELLPLLKRDFTPNVKHSLRQIGTMASAAYDYIQSKTNELWDEIILESADILLPAPLITAAAVSSQLVSMPKIIIYLLSSP